MKLTARHLELIEMLAKGMTNREIALALNITEGTVKQHLFTLFKKLKAPNRAKAVILGMQWIQQNGMPVPELPRATTVTYLRKIVTSVVIVPKDAEPGNLEDMALLDHQMAELLNAARPLVQAMEGRLTDTRRGGIHVSWGMERSHVDDAQRARLFVGAIHRWLETQSQLTVAIGVDQQEELHAWSARDAYFSPSYESAWQMARKAKATTVVVSERYRHALGAGAHASASRNGWVLDLTREDKLPADHDGLQQTRAWVESAWHAKTPAWMRLQGGTARQRNDAMQRLASGFSGSGRQCLQLYLPSQASVTTLADAVYTQINAQASLRRRPQGNRTMFQYGEASPEKAIEAIELLSLRGPLLLSISGQHAVEQWHSLMSLQHPASVWPDSPVVCVISDDHALQQSALTMVLSNGQTMAWPQPYPAAGAQDEALELLQWLDSLDSDAKSALRSWLDQTDSSLAEIGPNELSLPDYRALNHDDLLKSRGASLGHLMERLMVRPAIPTPREH